MTKKDYERAALIAQNVRVPDRYSVVLAFITFFQNDNPRFDSRRFRSACVPGARARKAAPKA